MQQRPRRYPTSPVIPHTCAAAAASTCVPLRADDAAIHTTTTTTTAAAGYSTARERVVSRRRLSQTGDNYRSFPAAADPAIVGALFACDR